jgi:hypothetical protein
MKAPLLVLLALFSACFGFSQTTGYCPTNAVFLALETEVRGYSTDANGMTAPCQILNGPQTTFGTARAISISPDDYLHVSQFLTNGTVNLFPPNSSGNATPSRTITTYTNDLVAIATDSNNTDFILSNREGSSEVVVVPNNATTPSSSFFDTDLQIAWGLAIDAENNLLLAGYTSSGVATIDTFAASANSTAPTRIRRLQGRSTALLFGNPSNPLGNTLAIALDPVTQELYVYNSDANEDTIQVSVFAAHATGSPAPKRVIRGSATQLGIHGDLGTSKISVSSDGRLFDAEPNNRILVFAAGASGNASPAQIIQDSTLNNQQVDQGGLVVRSCDCQ